MHNSGKRVVSCLAGLAFAVIGSALWEFVVRPAVTSAAEWTVKYVASRSDAFERELVRDIARGPSDYVAVSMYAAKTGDKFPLILVGLALLAVAFFKASVLRRLKEEGVDSDRAAIAAAGIVIIFLGVMTASPFGAARTQMVSSFVSHFEQSKRVVAPYVSEEELRMIDSRFARMQSFHDYSQIIAHLRTVAVAHSATLPTLKMFGTRFPVDRIPGLR